MDTRSSPTTRQLVVAIKLSAEVARLHPLASHYVEDIVEFIAKDGETYEDWAEWMTRTDRWRGGEADSWREHV